MSELEKVKIWIGLEGNDEDALITLLLEEAESMLQRLSRTPNDYKHLKIEAVIAAFNQRGAEGNKSTGSGGFNQTWYFDTMSSFLKSNMPAQYVIR